MEIKDIHRGEQYIINKNTKSLLRGVKVTCHNLSGDNLVLAIQYTEEYSIDEWVSPDNLSPIVEESKEQLYTIQCGGDGAAIMDKENMLKFIKSHPDQLKHYKVYLVGKQVDIKVTTKYELEEL
jgi:hypothetical protein